MRLGIRMLAVGACTILFTSGALASVAVGASGSAPPAKTKCKDEDLKCRSEQRVPGGRAVPVSSRDTGSAKRTCAGGDSVIIPCNGEYGIWSASHGCYLRADPKPPNLEAPDATGAWYLCHLPDSPVDTDEFTVWVEGPTPVDAAELARQLLAQIQLARVVIGITPQPGRTGLIGLPTYLWVDNPGPRTLGPISDSTSAGGVTVTLTAKVSRVVWNLGDGTTITCSGAGTPYRDEFGARPSPTCGHVYKRPSTSLPGGAYRVTATAVWDVAWTGGGQSGQIPFEVSSETSIRMGEAQALN